MNIGFDMKKSIRLMCVLLVLGLSKAYAQDPQFSQFYANQVLLSPAFTGAAEGPRLALNYRSQWAGIPGHYKTFAAAFDMPISIGVTKHGVGLSFMADQAGAGNLTKLDVLFNYAYNIQLGRDHALRFGLAAGIQQASIDFFQLRFPNQIDPFRSPNEPLPPSGENAIDSRINEQINAGVLYYNRYIWAGFNVNHITTPQQRFLNTSTSGDAALPRRYTAFAGAKIPFDRDRSGSRAISPAIMFRNQGPFTQLDLGTYLTIEPVVFGVWYRGLFSESDAIVGLIGLRRGMFSFGYSYDVTISELTNAISAGSHEVSLIIEFDRIDSKRAHRAKMSCPRF
jgi:type IX secretion system PorP/SprF family membrane protein